MSLTYTNPVYPDYFADPFVFRHGTLYYAIGTSQADQQRVFPMLGSEDLVHWHPLGRCLERVDEEFGADYWAPEIAFFDGTFYLYYSVGKGDKGHHLRVATSANPEGPYRDAGVLTDANKVPFAIDACPFEDDDGSWYLYYAIDFTDSSSEHRPGTALVVDRLIEMTRLAGDPKIVLRATSDWQRYQTNRPMYGSNYDWHTLEGPSVVKRHGIYYCFYSGGNWQNDTYGVDYCTAHHPMGPFEHGHVEKPRVLRSVPGKVLGPGHNSLVTGPDGQDFIVYHAWDPAATARRMCIDPIEWTPAGPRCKGPTWTEQPL